MDLNWTTLTIFTLPQMLWGICLVILTVIVHCVFAWAVYKDADRFDLHQFHTHYTLS